MTNKCAHCQTYRPKPQLPGSYCSNYASPFFAISRHDSDSCDQFYLRDKKAPAALRIANRAIAKMRGQ